MIISHKNLYILYSIVQLSYIAALFIDSKVFTISYMALCVYSFFGKKEALYSLSLMVISKYLNPAIFSFSSEAGILAWLVFFIACGRLIIFSLDKISKTFPLILFSITVGVISLYYSVQPDISIMKLVVFTIGAAAIIMGCSSLNSNDQKKYKIWIFTLVIMIVLLSLPTFLYPNIAYNRNAAGFQGILNHPQSFGPLLAPITAWFVTSLAFNRNVNFVLYSAVAILLTILMILSQARTSLAAIFLTMTVVFIVTIFQSQHFANKFSKRTLSICTFFIIAITISTISSTLVRDNLQSFIYKRESTNIDEALSSRSGGIASQWYQFEKSPIVGHGFGVYPWGDIPMGVTYYKGIPISAPVEKGFLPTAILEEVGLLGAALFFIFLYFMYRQVRINNDVEVLSIFLTCLFINVGEMVIFSLGGIGLFYWLLIGLSLGKNLK